MYGDDEYVELMGELWDDDPAKNAIALDIDDKIVWIPRSLIEDRYSYDEDGLERVTVPEWFAIQEGLV